MATATALNWPSTEELERVYKLVGQCHDELERLARWAKPIYEEGEKEASGEELGRLTAFLLAVSCDLDFMRESVEQVARARDAVDVAGFRL